MKHSDDKHIEAALQNFVRDLTAVSKKRGVAVMSMGGVFILEDNVQHITYSCDAARGNLEFRLSQ